jgi:hypothetical protein
MRSGEWLVASGESEGSQRLQIRRIMSSPRQPGFCTENEAFFIFFSPLTTFFFVASASAREAKSIA